MYKIEYDSQAKILKLRIKDTKSVDSDIKGNVVLDYDTKGNLVNIDVMEVNLDDLAKLAESTELKVT